MSSLVACMQRLVAKKKELMGGFTSRLVSCLYLDSLHRYSRSTIKLSQSLIWRVQQAGSANAWKLRTELSEIPSPLASPKGTSCSMHSALQCRLQQQIANCESA
jgi:hypothetical protein